MLLLTSLMGTSGSFCEMPGTFCQIGGSIPFSSGSNREGKEELGGN